jgi:hypothetical protein
MDVTLNIPHDDHADLTMNDMLCIRIIGDCDWTYTDTGKVFGPPPKGILAKGHYVATKPPTVHKYQPIRPGKVTFYATTTKDAKKKRTPHTIAVSSR